MKDKTCKEGYCVVEKNWDWGVVLQAASIVSMFVSAWILAVTKSSVHRALHGHNRDEYAHPILMEEVGSQAIEIQNLRSEVQQVHQVVNHTREMHDVFQKQNEQNHRTTMNLLQEIQYEIRGQRR
jgi:hypothetical protein